MDAGDGAVFPGSPFRQHMAYHRAHTGPRSAALTFASAYGGAVAAAVRFAAGRNSSRSGTVALPISGRAQKPTLAM